MERPAWRPGRADRGRRYQVAYDRYRSDPRRADAAGDHAAAALLRRYGKSITARRKLAALMAEGGG